MEGTKQSADLYLLDKLQTVNMKENFTWLTPLKNSVERIVNFGCWGGSEPFALLWVLDAKEVVIIERERENLRSFEEERQRLQNLFPSAFVARRLRTIVADMSSHIDDLPSAYFDLAYCENVLYYMDKDLEALQNAINEMSRVIKVGGVIIAVEPKFGSSFEEFEQDFLGIKIPRAVRTSEPKDMSKFFTDAGLIQIRMENAPRYSYCYQKPLTRSETGVKTNP